MIVFISNGKLNLVGIDPNAVTTHDYFLDRRVE
jgi:hypothetical protein